jgi:PAS domain S-box-containing protein
LTRLATALHPPGAPPGALRYLESSFALGDQVARGIPCLRADGSIFLADVASHPIDLGGRACLVGFIRDATESLRNEQRLRESEQQLQAQLAELGDVYKNSPVGLCVLDRDLRYVRINERLAEINGKSIEQHLGHTIWETVPDFAEYFAQLWRPIFETGKPLLNVEIHEERPKDSDRRRSFLASFYPLASATGEVTALMSSVVEITDRKRTEEQLRESEAKYRAVIDTTDTGFTIMDEEGRILDANQEYVRQTGHASLSDILGRRVTEWTASHDLARNADEIRKCMEYGFTRNLVIDYADAAKRLTSVEISATVVRTEDGTRILGLTRDITERKRAEREREQLQAELRHAQKMEAVGRLSGGVAHDFNNMLTVIKGNAAVASRALQTSKSAQDLVKLAGTLEEIQQAAYRASHLTGQLLTFSRKQVTEVQVLDLSAVVHDMEKMLRRLIREDIAFSIDCEPGAHLIEADRMQIEQALINLAVNASDAMPDGGQLGIRLGKTTLDDGYVDRHVGAAAGPHVVLAVADTGIGMDPATLDHLFEPFFTTKPYGLGTGLGLSIVYGIVRSSGGHITVESTPGRGSTFRLHIPVADGPVPHAVELPTTAWERGDETILLCEDEPSVRELIRSVLTEVGYSVIEADNGEQAVHLAKAHAGTFHLLITDVIMPGMKGDRVAETILKDQPGVRVLFMSGYASDVLTVDKIAERDLDFLQKPFRPQVLLQRVREILNEAAS